MLLVITKGHPGDTKITNLDLTRQIEENVLGSEIPMQNALFMHVNSRIQDLSNNVLDLTERKVVTSRIQQLLQGGLAILHDDERIASRGGHNFMKLHYVVMP